MTLQSATRTNAAKPGFTPLPSGLLQRKCAACGTHTPGGSSCLSCNKSGWISDGQIGNGGTQHRSVDMLPDHLLLGLHAMSGVDLSGVRVHQDSSAPAKVGAHAFAMGNDIHIAPGQEHHLPHEAWHIVQQRQGRVNKTSSIGELALNDDPGLENEADRIGGQAESMGQSAAGRGFATILGPLSGNDEDEMFKTVIAITGDVSAASAPVGQAKAVMQRATAFAAGPVTSTTNLAAHVIAGNRDMGFTPPTLNGNTILSTAAGSAAIRPPVLTGRSNVDGTTTVWVDSVPTNNASFTMQLPSAGPWSTATTTAAANTVFTSLGMASPAACATAGNTTFNFNGRPNDAGFVTNVTTHENLHAADHEVGFLAVIGAWDAKLEVAQILQTEFSGASQAAAEAALFTAMGGTPSAIGAAQFTEWVRLNGITHRGATLATGGTAIPSNAAANADCTTSSIDAT